MTVKKLLAQRRLGIVTDAVARRAASAATEAASRKRALAVEADNKRWLEQLWLLYRRPVKPTKRSMGLPPKLRLRAGRGTHISQQLNAQKETNETT